MESPASHVVVWGVFRLQNKTVVTINIKDAGNGTCLVGADLQLIFGSRADKDKALFFKTDKIWQKHLNVEMTKAVSIIEGLSENVS